MIGILPIRTSIRPRQTPYTNYALIIVNVVIFLLTYYPATGTGQILRLWANQFMLAPVRPHLWQFVSYAFLHGGFMHIIGNMFFLYLFGNNVNDKLGHIGYLCFYLAGAVFSAIGHIALGSLYAPQGLAVPMLGASGASAAVTGAYLVLFPQTMITVLYWFIFIGTMELPALYFIALKMILIDNVITRYTPNVAYDAHLSGYAFGILVMLAMLATGLTTTSGFDLFSMIKQWRRRQRYHSTVSGGYDPFTGRATAKHIKAKEVKKTPRQRQQEEKISRLRSEIAGWIAQRNLPAAANGYLELTKLDADQLLPRQHLLDIANQLASEQKSADSARAYEQFLAHYANYEYTAQVQLMLGVLYSRYLNQPDQARKHLQAAEKKLADPAQLKMCSDELEKLQNY